MSLSQLLPQGKDVWVWGSSEHSPTGPFAREPGWPSLFPLTLLSPLFLWTVSGMCSLIKHSSRVRRKKASFGQGSWLVSCANPGGHSPRSWRLGIKQAIDLVRSWHPQQGPVASQGWLMPSQVVGSLYADMFVEDHTVWAGTTVTS